MLRMYKKSMQSGFFTGVAVQPRVAMTELPDNDTEGYSFLVCTQVFAVAAFDEAGFPIGDGVGKACDPVETLNPLPLPLCWALLARTAYALGSSALAGQVRRRSPTTDFEKLKKIAHNPTNLRSCGIPRASKNNSSPFLKY